MLTTFFLTATAAVTGNFSFIDWLIVLQVGEFIIINEILTTSHDHIVRKVRDNVRPKIRESNATPSWRFMSDLEGVGTGQEGGWGESRSSSFSFFFFLLALGVQIVSTSVLMHTRRYPRVVERHCLFIFGRGHENLYAARSVRRLVAIIIESFSVTAPAQPSAI